MNGPGKQSRPTRIATRWVPAAEEAVRLNTRLMTANDRLYRAITATTMPAERRRASCDAERMIDGRTERGGKDQMAEPTVMKTTDRVLSDAKAFASKRPCITVKF